MVRKATNITYTDERGIEQELDGFKRSRNPFLVVFAITFILGILGGIVGTILLLGAPSSLQKKLGIDNLAGLVSDISRSERVTVTEESGTVEAVKKVSPAVVSIISKRNIADVFGNQTEAEGGGTGFIITSDGMILTNKHVVDQPAQYTVYTADGKNYEAKVLALDSFTDLAVVKIDTNGLQVVELGDSDKLEVGQKVIAIGNALGEFQNTVTTGVLSAKERAIRAGDATGQVSEQLEGLLQIDAAINSGNSGGPLVNIRGQVIGINTAVASKGQAEGIGFAIPINEAKLVIESVKKTGKIERPALGVRYVPITKEIAALNNLPVQNGAYVTSGASGQPAVLTGSPADKAGVKVNDVITKINGESIDTNHSLLRLLGQYSPGTEVSLEVVRGGKTMELKAKLVAGS